MNTAIRKGMTESHIKCSQMIKENLKSKIVIQKLAKLKQYKNV